MTFAQARGGLLFRFLGIVHPVYKTPVVSIWCQCLLACGAAFYLKEFSAPAGGCVFTMWIFYGLGVLSVIVLRLRQPELERPFRCWGYPFVPVVFVGVAAGMTVLSIHEAAQRGELWEQPLIWLVILLAGIPM